MTKTLEEQVIHAFHMRGYDYSPANTHNKRKYDALLKMATALEEQGFRVSMIWLSGTFRLSMKDYISKSDIMRLLEAAIPNHIVQVNFGMPRQILVRTGRKHWGAKPYWE